MGNTQVSSRLAEWIKPGDGVLTDFVNFFKKRDNAKDGIETVINVCDWMYYLGYQKDFVDTIRNDLDPVKQMLAVPAFIESLGIMRDKYRILTHSDDQASATVDFAQSVAGSSFALSESAIAGDSWNIYELGKEGLKAARTVFWGALAVIVGIDFYRDVDALNLLNKELEVIPTGGRKELLEHKVQKGYLSVLKSVTLLAMCFIALTSLLFASLAQGFLFSPVVFMTLSSAWLILNYTTYFYGKMIDRWENQLNPVAPALTQAIKA